VSRLVNKAQILKSEIFAKIALLFGLVTFLLLNGRLSVTTAPDY
jgi:hypothetical protein